MTILLAFGSNGSGQLGTGHKDDVSAPTQVILPPQLAASSSKVTITQIAAGGNHTLLLLSSGDVLYSGTLLSESDPSTTTDQFTPLPLPENTTAQHVACTWTGSIISCSNKKVYSLGVGTKGELGLSQATLSSPTLQEIPDFPPADTSVVALSASMSHAVAVLDNGKTYAWGANRKGQIGQPSSQAVHSPRLISEVPFPVQRAVCGREFTVLFGSPETGDMKIIGSDKWKIQTRAPEPPELQGWKTAGAGWGSVCVLQKDGALNSWGRNDHGQLGPAAGKIGTIQDIAVGSEHALALTQKGEVVAWGWGEHGNCGPLEEQQHKSGPSQIQVPTIGSAKVVMLGAGCATSWIVLDEHEVNG
ncbi:regulator of chromosome condensation 1/beta-lactamase-inhibitor protein II [Podospora australis]|uniref:Regulator of chromosome condensation 1/beta-lactamase-inhibitor protein II n=1 Tax=Podospora australis TaxID=1536484 RepID=A0AAN6X0Y3_9PEZI|nr:regulator of chromosome condensation 1/beta-lactamase-inhibitor protein II [Podospora australis]